MVVADDVERGRLTTRPVLALRRGRIAFVDGGPEYALELVERSMTGTQPRRHG
jgi:hypothetical protein